MAATSAKNLPYPLGTDRVMDGDDAIRRLAQSVDNMCQAGRVAITVTTGGTPASVALTFPVAYSAMPQVMATAMGSNPSAVQASAQSVATTGCLLFLSRGSAGTNDVMWLAIGPVAAVA